MRIASPSAAKINTAAHANEICEKVGKLVDPETTSVATRVSKTGAPAVCVIGPTSSVNRDSELLGTVINEVAAPLPSSATSHVRPPANKVETISNQKAAWPVTLQIRKARWSVTR